MGLSFFFLSQEHPDFLLENYHLPLSAQVISAGQAPHLLLRGSLSPGLTNRTSKAPGPSDWLVPASAPDFTHFSGGPIGKVCFHWAAELMGTSQKPLATTAATLEERLAENKANQERRAERWTES